MVEVWGFSSESEFDRAAAAIRNAERLMKSDSPTPTQHPRDRIGSVVCIMKGTPDANGLYEARFTDHNYEQLFWYLGIECRAVGLNQEKLKENCRYIGFVTGTRSGMAVVTVVGRPNDETDDPDQLNCNCKSWSTSSTSTGTPCTGIGYWIWNRGAPDPLNPSVYCGGFWSPQWNTCSSGCVPRYPTFCPRCDELCASTFTTCATDPGTHPVCCLCQSTTPIIPPPPPLCLDCCLQKWMGSSWEVVSNPCLNVPGCHCITPPSPGGSICEHVCVQCLRIDNSTTTSTTTTSTTTTTTTPPLPYWCTVNAGQSCTDPTSSFSCTQNTAGRTLCSGPWPNNTCGGTCAATGTTSTSTTSTTTTSTTTTPPTSGFPWYYCISIACNGVYACFNRAPNPGECLGGGPYNSGVACTLNCPEPAFTTTAAPITTPAE